MKRELLVPLALGGCMHKVVMVRAAGVMYKESLAAQQKSRNK